MNNRTFLAVSAAAAGALLSSPTGVAAPKAPPDLTAGASTVLGAAANPGRLDAFGDPYAVRSRVTAVRFHVGSTPSTAPGGLSATPSPVRRERNGVAFFEVTGELSGIGHHPIGFEYVYGPIDAAGVDRSADPASPRHGLAGIPFRLVYPAGWNGSLVVYRPAGDGGRGSGHYLFQSPVDELALVHKGYAWFTSLAGGTTPPDSNPYSTSGLFWRTGPPFWVPGAPAHRDFLRAARIDADWSEHLIPDSRPGRVSFPGEWFVPVPDPAPPIGSEEFASATAIDIQADVPTGRDQIRVAKNLLGALAGRQPSSTGLMAWSRSAMLALGLTGGRTQQPEGTALPLDRGLTPRTGGNYVRPYQPSSGRVVDWVLTYSGVEGVSAARPNGVVAFHPWLPDPALPMQAPFTWISPQSDASVFQINGYVYATRFADALPGSALVDKRIDSWFRTYTLPRATHQPGEAWVTGLFNGGGRTWFEPGAGFNDDGRGLELPWWLEEVKDANPELAPFPDIVLENFAGEPRTLGFHVAAIENARRWGATGAGPPVSRVDAALLDPPIAHTLSPALPVAPCDAEAVLFGRDFSCFDGIGEDNVLAWDLYFISRYDVALLSHFARTPLTTSTEPIVLPDVSAPLGIRFLTSGAVLLRAFTDDELRARYGDHDGYVSAYAAAVDAAVADGLYDATIGALEVERARASSVLR